MFPSIFKRRPKATPENPKSKSVFVNYGVRMYMPDGALRLLHHKPALEKSRVITPDDLVLEGLPRGVTCDEFVQSRGNVLYADTIILDSFVNTLVENNGNKKTLSDFFGHDEKIIFFFGTLFEARGKAHCQFLNLSKSLAALRYLYGMDKTFESHVPCFAAYIKNNAQLLG